MTDFRIAAVDADNVDELGFFCVGSKTHPGYITKRRWLRERFKEGLKIKLAVTDQGAQAGFIEYAPGEYTWRAVDAPGYFVIHCIWVKSAKFPNSDLAAMLLEDCFSDAVASGRHGVAVVSSDGTWMAGKGVFLKHGFTQVDQAEPHFQLLARRTGAGPLPAFPQDWAERLGNDRELRLLFTNQCPYIGKVISELPKIALQHGIRLQMVELNDAAEARKVMPSPYGVFSLVCNGRLLADHPISATRFRNILRKDLRLEVRGGP